MSARVNSPTGTTQEQAAAWHARLSSEASTDADWLAFDEWLQNATNRAAYEVLEQQVEVVAAHPETFSKFLPDAEASPAHMSPTMVRFAVLGAVAAAATFFLLSVTADHPKRFAYEAAASGTRSITLPDASVVDLNRGAAIRGEWRRGLRTLVLERGEAAFRVVHDDARPLEVVVGNVTLHDLGTEFNVIRTAGGVQVSVREGSIELRQGDQPSGVIAAGFQARVENGQTAITSTNSADDAFAWRTGRLVYHDAPLFAVLSDLSRYSATPIVAADAQTGSLRFSGVLIIDDSQLMLRRLASFLPIQLEQNADRVVVRSRR